MIYNRPEYWIKKEPRTAFLTFISPNPFSIKTNNSIKNWDGVLEYSTDTANWKEWDGSEISARRGNDGYVLYFSGTGNTVITGSMPTTTYKNWLITGSDVQCIGNIETLLDYEMVYSGEHPTMETYCYYYMFRNCTGLTQAPELPATTMTEDCYDSMFYGCTGLTQAPELPATTLASGCYDSMFYGCTGLTQAPKLPATTLVNDCYANMFYGCTGLTQAPELPATTMTEDCYFEMFNGCTGLTQAPELPATILGYRCYRGMFRNCTNLIQAPSLPATTLESYCYSYMFRGCTSLTQVPSLPATTLKSYCYSYMFEGCKKIKLSATETGKYTKAYRIPQSGTGTKSTSSLQHMFDNTGGTFNGEPSINTTYYLDSSNAIV